MMIYCDLLCALVLSTLVMALLFEWLTLPHILVVGFLEGTFIVCYRLAAAAAVPNVVHGSQLPQALARRRGAAMLGKPLGGVLFGVGRAVPFLFDVVSYAVSVLTLGWLSGRRQVEPAVGARAAAEKNTQNLQRSRCAPRYSSFSSGHRD